MEITEVNNQSMPLLDDGIELSFNISTNSTPVIDNDGRLVSDVWVSIVLILMTLSCIGCVCSCLLYYKFQKWKVSDGSEEADSTHADLRRRPSKELPPSYTFVTGLPTYEQAVVLCGSSPVYSMDSRSNSPVPFTPLHGEEAQMSSIMTVEINSTKGVYPNPPLTPPTVSPSRIATSSASHPAAEVHRIKI